MEKSRMSVAQPSVPDDMLYEVVDGRDQGEDRGSAGKRNRDVADRIPRPVRPNASAGQGVRGDDLSDRSWPKIFSDGRTSHSFLIRNGRSIAGLPRSAFGTWSPTWPIEVVSPTNSAVDVQRKIHEYFEAGVSKVWVIYPEQKKIYIYASPTQIQVLQLGDELDGGDLLPGFRLPLSCVVRR